LDYLIMVNAEAEKVADTKGEKDSPVKRVPAVRRRWQFCGSLQIRHRL